MQLDLRFIVPGPADGTILLTSDGTLPSAAVEGHVDEATVVAATAYLRDVIGFRMPILETHPRWAGIPEGDPIPTLVLTEAAPTGWTPPPDALFGSIPTVLDGIPAAILPRAEELLEELRSDSAPPPLRPRWARAGWQPRASGWMATASAAAGRPLVGDPRPFYLRGISALLRAPTSTGHVFLKAVFPPFHAEPAVTRLLADRFPGSVPRVLAIEPDEGWLLVEDVGAGWIGDLPADQRPAGLEAGAHALVAIQQAIADDVEPLAAAGAPSRPLADVPEALDTVLGPDGIAMVEGPVSTERHERAVAATWQAIDRVTGLGFPTTVVHGDFHPGNAALVDGRAVIIDWSDAAIGNPLVDLVTWVSWSAAQPDDERVATDAWVDAWSGVTDSATIRDRIDDILVAGAAYQIVSYEGIVAALEPATRYTMADGASGFLRRLEEILDRT